MRNQIFLLGIIILIITVNYYTLNEENVDKLILNLSEASEYLSISKSKLSTLALQKKIRSYKIGKCRRFHIKDLNAFLESHAEGGDNGGMESGGPQRIGGLS